MTNLILTGIQSALSHFDKEIAPYLSINIIFIENLQMIAALEFLIYDFEHQLSGDTSNFLKNFFKKPISVLMQSLDFGHFKVHLLRSLEPRSNVSSVETHGVFVVELHLVNLNPSLK